MVEKGGPEKMILLDVGIDLQKSTVRPSCQNEQRLRDGRFFQQFECWNLLADPLVAVFHPVVRQVVVMAEREGEKDCVLCDVDLGIGHLSVVCIGPERHGRRLLVVAVPNASALSASKPPPKPWAKPSPTTVTAAVARSMCMSAAIR